LRIEEDSDLEFDFESMFQAHL